MTEKHEAELIDHFILNLKKEFTGIPHAATMPKHYKATTSEITWRHWMHKSPQAEFFTRRIGSRVYYMMAEKHNLN